jgi:hypothetical protein
LVCGWLLIANPYLNLSLLVLRLGVFRFWFLDSPLVFLNFPLVVGIGKFFKFEEVLKMERVRKLYLFDVVEILRKEGIVIDDVVMDTGKFVKRCHLLGFDPDKVYKVLHPF